MSDNLRIWKALEKTDPKHTKSFKRAGGFSGTAMKPIWMTKRLTEQFGPAGIGWGMDQPTFEVVNAGDEILVFCTVGLWYMDDGKQQAAVYGVGGDKILGKNKYGPYTNDEAFKASYTDALSNAMKQIGVGADIHMGLFDDEKYVRETAREFAADEKAMMNEMAGPNARRDADGELMSTRQIAVQNDAKERADQAIQAINALRPEEARDWARQNKIVVKPARKSFLGWIEDNSPEQYMRVKMAYENVTGDEL